MGLDQDTLLRYIAQDTAEATNPHYSYTTDMAEIFRLTDYQRTQMKHDPVMVIQFAQHMIYPIARRKYDSLNGYNETLALEAGNGGVSGNGKPSRVVMNVDIWRSLNNRPFQRWIDPETDILKLVGIRSHGAVID